MLRAVVKGKVFTAGRRTETERSRLAMAHRLGMTRSRELGENGGDREIARDKE